MAGTSWGNGKELQIAAARRNGCARLASCLRTVHGNADRQPVAGKVGLGTLMDQGFADYIEARTVTEEEEAPPECILSTFRGRIRCRRAEGRRSLIQ
jgi:hypothetical protein